MIGQTNDGGTMHSAQQSKSNLFVHFLLCETGTSAACCLHCLNHIIILTAQ